MSGARNIVDWERLCREEKGLGAPAEVVGRSAVGRSVGA